MMAQTRTTPQRKQEQCHYYAIRRCESLKRPAIFWSWEDCQFYVSEGMDDDGENDDDDASMNAKDEVMTSKVHYKRCHSLKDAEAFVWQEQKKECRPPPVMATTTSTHPAPPIDGAGKLRKAAAAAGEDQKGKQDEHRVLYQEQLTEKTRKKKQLVRQGFKNGLQETAEAVAIRRWVQVSPTTSSRSTTTRTEPATPKVAEVSVIAPSKKKKRTTSNSCHEQTALEVTEKRISSMARRKRPRLLNTVSSSKTKKIAKNKKKPQVDDTRYDSDGYLIYETSSSEDEDEDNDEFDGDYIPPDDGDEDYKDDELLEKDLNLPKNCSKLTDEDSTTIASTIARFRKDGDGSSSVHTSHRSSTSRAIGTTRSPPSSPIESSSTKEKKQAAAAIKLYGGGLRIFTEHSTTIPHHRQLQSASLSQEEDLAQNVADNTCPALLPPAPVTIQDQHNDGIGSLADSLIDGDEHIDRMVNDLLMSCNNSAKPNPPLPASSLAPARPPLPVVVTPRTAKPKIQQRVRAQQQQVDEPIAFSNVARLPPRSDATSVSQTDSSLSSNHGQLNAPCLLGDDDEENQKKPAARPDTATRPALPPISTNSSRNGVARCMPSLPVLKTKKNPSVNCDSYARTSTTAAAKKNDSACVETSRAGSGNGAVVDGSGKGDEGTNVNPISLVSESSTTAMQPPSPRAASATITKQEMIDDDKGVPPEEIEKRLTIQKLQAKNEFPFVLHNLLDFATQNGKQHIICWTYDGKSFQVLLQHRLAAIILPKYFGKNFKYPSFENQLQLWGFRNNAAHTNANSCSQTSDGSNSTSSRPIHIYSHQYFHEGKKELCAKIKKKGTQLPKRVLPKKLGRPATTL